jgi:ribosomal protein S8
MELRIAVDVFLNNTLKLKSFNFTPDCRLLKEVLYILNDLGYINTSESVTKLMMTLDEYTTRKRNLLKN